MRGRSVSNATRSKFDVPLASGLLNSIGLGCISASWPALLNVPGQVFWYGTPSKSASVPRHPATLIMVDWEGLKQPTSSLSEPAGSLTLEPLHPRVLELTPLQYSKCPIS